MFSKINNLAFQNSNASAAILFGHNGQFTSGYDMLKYSPKVSEADFLAQIVKESANELPKSKQCKKVSENI
jgi:hypothetical protein